MCCAWLAGNAGPTKSPKIRRLRTIALLSSYIFATKACVDNRKKNLLKSNISSTCPHNMANFHPTNSWDRFGSLRHPSKFQWFLGDGGVAARHSSSGRQPNFLTLNSWRHLYLAGRPSCWALAHILVLFVVVQRIKSKQGNKYFMQLCAVW